VRKGLKKTGAPVKETPAPAGQDSQNLTAFQKARIARITGLEQEAAERKKLQEELQHLDQLKTRATRKPQQGTERS
jgi:hypothetical protein